MRKRAANRRPCDVHQVVSIQVVAGGAHQGVRPAWHNRSSGLASTEAVLLADRPPSLLRQSACTQARARQARLHQFRYNPFLTTSTSCEEREPHPQNNDLTSKNQPTCEKPKSSTPARQAERVIRARANREPAGRRRGGQSGTMCSPSAGQRWLQGMREDGSPSAKPSAQPARLSTASPASQRLVCACPLAGCVDATEPAPAHGRRALLDGEGVCEHE